MTVYSFDFLSSLAGDFFFFFSSRRRHTRWNCDWSSDVCSSDLFGYGLSYTTFKFENVRVEPATILPGGNATVKVDVTNTGTREGDEVAQLYLHQKVATITRPVKELRGFH